VGDHAYNNATTSQYGDILHIVQIGRRGAGGSTQPAHEDYLHSVDMACKALTERRVGTKVSLVWQFSRVAQQAQNPMGRFDAP
jgi:hypothetical protein